MKDVNRVNRIGRPKSVEKRMKILNAASRLFLQHGITSTSMDQVATLSKVSKQTVYSHFSNKDALYLAVIDVKCQEYAFGLQFSHDSQLPLNEVLTQLGRQFVRLMLDDEVSAMYRTVIGESHTNSHVAEIFFEAGPKRAIDDLCNYLLTVSNEDLKEAKARCLSIDFFNLLSGDYHIRTLLSLPIAMTPGYESALVERAVDHVLHHLSEVVVGAQ